jgi:hypothetical protein
MLDMKKWSSEIKNLLNQNFGSQTYWEQDMWDNNKYSYTWTMTPYQTVTESNGYLIPDQETTPGWSGSNVVPLKVKSGATEVTVSFYPNGANSNNTNMNFLLCYRATDGTPVYSEPITGEGSATLRLDKTPSSTNGTQMVFAVIVNTDYQYTGNTGIRKLHYDYKLKPETGINGAGAANVKYYNDFKLDYNWPEIGEIPVASSSSVEPVSSSSAEPNSSSSEPTIKIVYEPLDVPTHINVKFKRGILTVDYALPQREKVMVSLFTGYGALIAQDMVGVQSAGAHTHTFDLTQMPAGTYIVKVTTGSYREAKSVNIVR